MEANILTQLVLPLSLFIIMLGMGLSLTPADFMRVFQQPKAVTIGIACQMIVLPLVACGIIVLFGLTAELAVGLLIIALCPGGTTSNLISFLAKGDVALSISLTALVSIVTPFTIPIVTALAMTVLLDESQQVAIPILQTILQLVVITIVPVGIGMLVYRKYPSFAIKTQQPVKIFSVVFLFLIIAGLMIGNWNDILVFFTQAGLASLTLNVSCLAAGYFIAKLTQLNKPQSVSISIEVGMQNGTLALLVAGTLIGNSIMTIPAITYSLLMFLTGGIFAWLISRKSD